MGILTPYSPLWQAYKLVRMCGGPVGPPCIFLGGPQQKFEKTGGPTNIGLHNIYDKTYDLPLN